MASIELSETVYKSIHEVIKGDLIGTEKDALLDYSLMIALSRNSEFEDDCKRFRNKYKTDFTTFEEHTKSEGENFEKEDDYLAWRFAEEGLRFWGAKVKELRDAL